MRTLVLALAALAAACAPAAASSPLDPQLGAPGLTTAQAGLDFGDAPDGRPARYAGKPRVRGRFPSRAASGGPRHSTPGPSIGGWTGEADSRQVDRDRDDGAHINPRRCAMSTLTVAVDASQADPSQPLYANAWFDWNRDGDWADGGTQRCGPEWGIQNQVIDRSTLGDDGRALVTLSFRAGRVPRQFWWRVQVHAGSPVPHAAGGEQATPSAGGETEDWFYERRPGAGGPPVELRCFPALWVVQHGWGVGIGVRLDRDGDPRITIREVRARLTGQDDGLTLSDGTSGSSGGSLLWSYTVSSHLEHARDPVLQHALFTVTIDALVNGRKRELQDSCAITVSHGELIELPPGPVVLTPAPGAGFAARCGANFVDRSEGTLGGGLVVVRCDGVNVKTVSISAGGQNQRMLTWEPEENCGAVLEGRGLRCIYGGRNRGRRLAIDYSTTERFSSMRLHILAGGRGRIGTTIVLLQDWFLGRDRVRCSQSVPAAEECALPQ